jgi:hypothetical protein
MELYNAQEYMNEFLYSPRACKTLFYCDSKSRICKGKDQNFALKV